MNAIDITFFIPCFNAEKTVIETIISIKDAMDEFNYSYEIVVVDDYSNDNSAKLVRSYSDDHSDMNIVLIRQKQNYGLGHNFVEAAIIGKGRYYKMVHAGNIERKDGTTKLISCLGEADIITSYVVDNRKYFRQLLSTAYTWLVGILSGYSLKYYQGSALFIRKDVLLYHPYNNGNAFLSELLTILMNNGRSVIEVEVEQIRSNSRSTATSWRNVISVIQGLINIL